MVCLRTIDRLLESRTDKTISNYHIEHIRPGHVMVYYYRSLIAEVDFNVRRFKTFYSYPSPSTTRAVNYIRRKLAGLGFIDHTE